MRPFFIFALSAFLCSAGDLTPVHVRNFAKVDDHIYRGGEPTLVGLTELGAMGVKTVIDLRLPAEGSEFEKQEAGKLKLKYINVPMGEFSAPTNAQVEQVLALLQDSSGTVFVHCRRGKDRTGTVIACYRIQHDGWDNQRALEEAKEHGLSGFEHAMRSYILHFTPLKLTALPEITPVTAPGVPIAAK